MSQLLVYLITIRRFWCFTLNRLARPVSLNRMNYDLTGSNDAKIVFSVPSPRPVAEQELGFETTFLQLDTRLGDATFHSLAYTLLYEAEYRII